MPVTDITKDIDQRTIVITAEFDAPVERVWAIYADPRQLDVVRYEEGTQAGAATDPRQFTWLPEQRTVLTVVSQGWTGTTGWVSVLSLADGSMSNRMVEVEHGTDVADVRLVPLASGKVALVTGDDVSFFDL